jgi:hypothetical protein
MDNIYGGWETLDTAALLARRDEATNTSNVGSYTVPLGTDPLRREVPVGHRPPFPPCDGTKFCALGDVVSWGNWEDPLAGRMY